MLEAANGHEALAVAQEHRLEEIQLLLTDVVMPLMSGRELGKSVKEIRPDTRVLFTSGYTQDTAGGDGALGMDAGFLQKPFTPLRLANKVREVLAGREQQRAVR